MTPASPFTQATPPPAAPSAPAPAPATQSAPPTITGQPFMVQVSRPDPDRELLRDVVIGSFGLTGALVLGALLAGAVLAGLWIGWRKLTRRLRDDRPPSLGSVPLSRSDDATRLPSSPDR